MAVRAEPKPPSPSMWERHTLKQAERQAAFDELVATGQLIVRQMTIDEKRKWAARKQAGEHEPPKRRPPRY